jgi:prepilin-type N-terminal cleavage/methylation domain-containing protein
MARSSQRGFTLIELMVVVVIAGVLATLATYGVRKYIFAAKTSEAIEMIGAIKSAQEAYKDETFTYLDVSDTIDSYYPPVQGGGLPGRAKVQWGGADSSLTNWNTLGVNPNGPVLFGYACVAGGAGAAIPDVGTAENLNFPAPGAPWYVVKAVADQNGDDNTSIYIGSSFTSQIHVENETE